MPVGRAGLLGIALVCAAPVAQATTCVKPDLIDTLPPDGAVRVPTNATLTAHYESTAEYLGEDVTLAEGDAPAESVPARFDSAEGLLSVTPPNGLVPGGHYVIAWPKLRGIGTASLGRGLNASFTVTSAEDTASPSFEGLRAIDWDVRRAQDDCTGTIEQRFVFDVTPGHASDDLGTELLALLVLQTRGGGVDTSPEQVLLAPLPSEGKSVRVERSIAAATGHVCFSAIVKDLTGKPSSGNGANREVCVDATAPPFFYGCRVTPLGRSGRPPSATPLLASLVLVLSAHRRRQRPAP